MRRFAIACLVLPFLVAEPVLAGGAGAPVASQFPSVEVAGLRITADMNGIQATQGSRLVWRNPDLVGFNLQRGPGRWVTVQGGARRPLSGQFNVQGLILDPRNGRVKARAAGYMMYHDSSQAFFMSFPLLRLPLNSSAEVVTVTRVPASTLSPQRVVVEQSMLPRECRESSGALGYASGSYTVKASNSPSIQAKKVFLNLGLLNCDIKIRVDFSKTEITILDFKVNK